MITELFKAILQPIKGILITIVSFAIAWFLLSLAWDHMISIDPSELFE